MRAALAVLVISLGSSACPIGVCGPCSFGEVCVRDVNNGDRCDRAAIRGETCSRRSDTPPEGELDHACAPGLACEVAISSFIVESICVPPDGPRLFGEPCTASTVRCADGLVCAEGSGVDVCKHVDGEPCVFADECASGACGADGRCALHECSHDDDCPFDDVCAGSECGSACEAPARRGEACVTLSAVERCDERKACAEDLVCAIDISVRSDAECLPQTDRARGEFCRVASECASGACEGNVCT